MSLDDLEKNARRAARWLAGGSGVLLLAITVLMIADAILRYGFARPIGASVELAQQLLGMSMFLALPLTELSDSHVRVDSLTSRLWRTGRLLSLAVGSLVIALLMGAIAWQMWFLLDEMIKTERVTVTARIPVAPFLAVAFGCALCACAASALRAACTLARIAGAPDAV